MRARRRCRVDASSSQSRRRRFDRLRTPTHAVVGWTRRQLVWLL